MTPPHPPRRDGKTPRHRRSRGISTAAYGARSCSAAANELGRAHIIDALTHRTDPDGTLALKDLIASAQQQLGDHPAFPNGRLRNYCTFTKVDREARNLVERVPRNSPQQVRLARTHIAERTASGVYIGRLWNAARSSPPATSVCGVPRGVACAERAADDRL